MTTDSVAVLKSIANAHEYFAANGDLRMSTGDHERQAKRLRAVIAALTPSAPASNKPAECANGCPPFQVCDYCQGVGGRDATPPHAGQAEQDADLEARTSAVPLHEELRIEAALLPDTGKQKRLLRMAAQAEALATRADAPRGILELSARTSSDVGLPQSEFAERSAIPGALSGETTLVPGDADDMQEALSAIATELGCACTLDDILHVIDALRSTPPLAGQREDAPVAWMLRRVRDDFIRGCYTDKPSDECIEIAEISGDYYTPLFTRPASDAVVDDARLIAAYDAGFEASSEGWNGEYGGNTDSPYYINKRNEYFAALASQQAGGSDEL